MSEIIKLKECSICKHNKEANCFGKYKNSPDSLRWECKECRKKSYWQNVEYQREMKRLDYQKHREQRSITLKNYYYDNKEECLLRRKDYYSNNKEKVLESQKQYRENNREAVAQRKKEYAIRKKQEKLEWLEKNLMTVNYPPEYRVCTICNSLKLIENNFNIVKGKNIQKIRYRGYCKDCESQINKEYRKEHGDRLRLKNRQKRAGNPEFYRERHKKNRNSEVAKIRHALPENRIIRNVTQYVRFALGEVGLKKDGRATMKYLGCTRQFFRDYIKLQFSPGMTWENYGNKSNEWSLDHYIPKEAFNILNLEEQNICFNWKNCQPMWHIDNEIKQDKMPDGRFARDTKNEYTLEQKKSMIEERLKSLDLSNIIS